MKPSKFHIAPVFIPLGILAAFIGSSTSFAQLIWDRNGATSPNPSDGAGKWLDAELWWNGSANVTWNNVTNSGTIATLGSGGTAGAIDLEGNVNAGGLLLTNVVSSTYSFTNGALNLAENALIDLRDGSSSTSNRLSFGATSVIGGNNITITSNNGVNQQLLGLVTLQSTANTWTGTLTLSGNTGKPADNSTDPPTPAAAGGLFVDATHIGSLSSLGKIKINSNATLVINYTGTDILNVPIEITGSGAGSRGALRFDRSQTLGGNIVLTGATTITAINSSVGTLNGNISGNFGLTLSNNTQPNTGTIVFKGNNTFTTLTVARGNAQIGEGGVGTSGTGTVALNNSAAIVSGTGLIKAAFNVTNGVVRPGDNGGAGLGQLNVGGNLTFNVSEANARTIAEFTLAAPTGTHGVGSDRLNVTGNLTLSGNGNFAVIFDTSTYTPQIGDSWSLIGYGGTLNQGTFSIGTNLRTGADSDANEGNLNLPNLSPYGYLWDVSLGSGSLTATIVVPETSHTLLGALGFLGILGIRRRKGIPGTESFN